MLLLHPCMYFHIYCLCLLPGIKLGKIFDKLKTESYHKEEKLLLEKLFFSFHQSFIIYIYSFFHSYHPKNWTIKCNKCNINKSVHLSILYESFINLFPKRTHHHHHHIYIKILFWCFNNMDAGAFGSFLLVDPDDWK